MVRARVSKSAARRYKSVPPVSRDLSYGKLSVDPRRLSRRVALLLEAAGHSVAAPDLPGHGDDATPISELSLERYGAFVAELASSYRPFVLGGHSMAGAVISRVAEAVPDQIERLIYLTADLPHSREWLVSLA